MRREICGECGSPISDDGTCDCTELLKRGWRQCAVGQKTTQWCPIAESVRGELREQMQRDEALLRQALEALGRAHQAAMVQTLKMRERPIIFSAPMVRAVLSGAKTQTRRLVRPQPEDRCPLVKERGYAFRNYAEASLGNVKMADGSWGRVQCHYGLPGDRLWVRETWRVGAWDESTCCVATDYKADGYCRREWLRVDDEDLFIRLRQQCIDDARAALGPADRYTWEPGRSPCRWRPSIHMPRWASRITLEITDVRLEQLQDISEADAVAEGCTPIRPELGRSAVEEFRLVWEQINGPGSWNANPWVWVIEFKKLEHKEQA